MAISAIASIKSMLGRRSQEPSRASVARPAIPDEDLDPLPTVGFRAAFHPHTGQLHVTVLGARHLPARMLTLVADTYLVKVKLFPGREKFETKEQPESWPTFNEDFTFHIDIKTIANTSSSKSKNKKIFSTPSTNPASIVNDHSAVLCGSRFLLFTVYAVDSKKIRRPVGAATWPLDYKAFAANKHSSISSKTAVETAEIWKRLQDIKTGLSSNHQGQNKREFRKNQLEVWMKYTPGDVGENDILSVVVTRLRWSLDLTREYEQKKAQLYIKLSALEVGGYCIGSHNSKPFPPSISVHLEPDEEKALLDVKLPPAGPRREGMIVQLSLCTRPSKLGKKLVLGRAKIGCMDESVDAAEEEGEQQLGHVGQALQSPGVKVTQWHTLL